jgi:hypothetical protein
MSSLIYSLSINENNKIEKNNTNVSNLDNIEKEKDNESNDNNFINKFQKEKTRAFKEATRKGDFYFIYLFFY